MRTRAQTEDATKRALWRAAATLRLKRPGGKRRPTLPTVFFVTDPERTPDPVRIAMGLPRGSGVIFRGFGRPDAARMATKLAKVSKRRGLVLLIGADEVLAARVGAQGVHLPERDLARAPRLRQRRPNVLITGAAHSTRGLAAARRARLDAVLLSAIFPSKSPSAATPLGPVKLAIIARRVGLPLIALGGVNGSTAKRLVGTGISGFAAVEGLLQVDGST